MIDLPLGMNVIDARENGTTQGFELAWVQLIGWDSGLGKVAFGATI